MKKITVLALFLSLLFTGIASAGFVAYDTETFGMKAEVVSIPVFSAFDTHTFGMKAAVTDSIPVISNVAPGNGSTSVIAYPFLNITVTDPSGLDINVSWSTNASGSWLYWNSSIASGSTVRQRATFANTSETKYWWTVKVNNTNGDWTNATYHFTLSTYTWGEWSGWWVVYYTDCDESLNFTSQANSTSMIFLNWTIGNNSDKTHVRWDTNTYPIGVSEGNLSCNITDHSYEQSGLLASTLYYFTAWSYNNTNNTFSYNTSTTSSTTDAGNTAPTQSGEVPVNGSTNINLTPSLYVICSDADLDTMNATWWSNSSSNWVQFASNTSISTGTNITQPNSNFSACSTTYYWSVNLSDGNSSWNNITYEFTTEPVSPPSSFNSLAYNQTQINITWVKGIGADNTTILRNATEYANYPNSPTNGTVIYNNTGTNYEDVGFAPGITCYYTAWSWNTTQSIHSIENSTSSATTDLSNYFPTISSPNPANSSTGQNLALTWSCNINDAEGNPITYHINCSNGQSSTAAGVSNGTRSVSLPGLSYSIEYFVYVNASDPSGSGNWARDWYRFTTKADTQPSAPSDPQPENVAPDIPIDSSNMSVYVSDPDGDTLSVGFYWAGGPFSNHTLIQRETGVASGSIVTIAKPTGLTRNTVYWWYVNVSDGILNTTGGNWSFTTRDYDAPNQPTNVIPINSSIGVSINPTLSMTVTDPAGADVTLNVSFYSSAGVLIGADNDLANGSTASVIWSGRSYSTIYGWYVNISNSEGNWTRGPESDNFSFTTAAKDANGDGKGIAGDNGDGDDESIPTAPSADFDIAIIVLGVIVVIVVIVLLFDFFSGALGIVPKKYKYRK